MSICTLLIFLSNASCRVDGSDAKLRLPADKLRSTVARAYTDAVADVRSDWLRSTVMQKQEAEKHPPLTANGDAQVLKQEAEKHPCQLSNRQTSQCQEAEKHPRVITASSTPRCTVGNDSGKLPPTCRLCMRSPCTQRKNEEAGVRVFRRRRCEAIHKHIDILLRAAAQTAANGGTAQTKASHAAAQTAAAAAAAS
jgi:hypothetical protein